MGVILSRFRKKKSTLEVLEGLETAIKSIEEYHRCTEQQHKKILGHLMLYSAGLYVLIAFLFYFCFFPATRYEQILYLLPLLIMPVLFIFVRRMVTWYYRRKLSHNEKKLSKMHTDKKQLLEEVMDKETYKVAREILEKFAPDQLRKGSAPPVLMPRPGPHNALALPVKSSSMASPGSTLMPPGSELRRRPVGSPGMTPSSSRLMQGSPIGHMSPNAGRPMSASPLGSRPVMGMPRQIPMPRPILPRDRSVMDRLVEYLVGDGPSNRYALICQRCSCHNGMALKEEFEYFSFRCCYCGHWNPARKQRPQAPRLEQNMPSDDTSSTSEAESPVTSEEDDLNAANLNDDTKSDDEPVKPESANSEGEEGAGEPKIGDLDLSTGNTVPPPSPFGSSEEEQQETLTTAGEPELPPLSVSPAEESVGIAGVPSDPTRSETQ